MTMQFSYQKDSEGFIIILRESPLPLLVTVMSAIVVQLYTCIYMYTITFFFFGGKSPSLTATLLAYRYKYELPSHQPH